MYQICNIVLGWHLRNPEDLAPEEFLTEEEGADDEFELSDEEFENRYNALTSLLPPIKQDYSGTGDGSPAYIGWDLTEITDNGPEEVESLDDIQSAISTALEKIGVGEVRRLSDQIEALPQKYKDLLQISKFNTWLIWSTS